MSKYSTIFICILVVIFSKLHADTQPVSKDSTKAESLYNTGRKLYSENNFNQALDSFMLSLQLRKKILGNEHIKTLNNLNAIGITFKAIGQYDLSIEYFLKAEKILEKKGNTLQLANLYNNIGNIYKSKLDYITALEYYNRSIDIYQKQEQVNEYDISDIYYNISDIYKNIGEYKKALEIINNHYSKAYPDTKLYFLDLKGIVYQMSNNNIKAEDSYIEAINEAKELQKKGYLSNIEVAHEYLNYASFLGSTGKINKAHEILRKAHKIIIRTESEQGKDLAEYYFILGGLFVNEKVESTEISAFKKQKTQNLRKAIAAYQNGLKALNFDFNPASDSIPDIGRSLSLIQSLDFLKLIADTYVKIADVFDDTNKNEYIQSLQYALDYYRITATIIQNARKEITSDDSKIQLAELEQATFHKMIKTAYQAYEITGNKEILNFAFKNAERIKASTIFDQLSGELAKNELIPDSLLELEKNLNYKITRRNEFVYNLLRDEIQDSAKIADAESTLFELKKQRDELDQHLENNYPGYYDLKYSDQLLGIDDIQNKLKTNEVVIEYVLSENDTTPELFAFLISRDISQFIHPKIDSTFINATINSFRFMSDSRYMFIKNNDAKQFCVEANYLYNKLITPFEDEIQDKKLLIIPDGKLNYIAFDALVEKLPDTTGRIDFSKLDYMIKSNSINYSYSANLLYGFDKKSKKAKHKLLAFAPEYSEDTILFNNKQLALMPLPGIQKEVDLIGKEIKSKIFKGKDASEQNFRKHSSDFDIIHLAMHAFIDDSDPAFSSLAFSQNKNDDAENNGRLNTADIYNLDLNARLTVLSACNTGSGELKKGEGVMSLARGFFYAGCPSIVMTLWEVDDKAGTQIMSSFYRNLKKGRAVDESLRLAKLEYLENANPRTAHPHYWLGYVSIGDSSPLFRSYDYYFFGLLIIALLAVTVDQLIRMRKFRKNYKQQN